MDFIVIAGVLLTVVGLAILIWCILGVARAKRKGLDEDAMRSHVQKAVIWNLAAMALSGMGLTVLIVGLVLG